jgi:hypothetical protein
MRPTVALMLLLVGLPLHAAERRWQPGVLRDVQIVTGAGAAVSIPLGGSASTMVAGVPVGGAAPFYVSVPIGEEWQYVTIDGQDGLRYMARWHQRLEHAVVNAPILFAVDGVIVYVKGDRQAEAKKRLRLVSTTHLDAK